MNKSLNTAPLFGCFVFIRQIQRLTYYIAEFWLIYNHYVTLFNNLLDNRSMHNVSKWSLTLWKSCSKRCKIYKVCDHLGTLCINLVRIKSVTNCESKFCFLPTKVHENMEIFAASVNELFLVCLFQIMFLKLWKIINVSY